MRKPLSSNIVCMSLRHFVYAIQLVPSSALGSETRHYAQRREWDDRTRAQRGWKPAPWCRATISFYPEFDGMLSKLADALATTSLEIGSWGEMRLLAELSAHPCRTMQAPAHSLGGTSPTPHFRLAPVPWMGIAALPAAEQRVFSRQAAELLTQLSNQPTFRLNAAYQVVFWGGGRELLPRDPRRIVVRMPTAGSNVTDCSRCDACDACSARTLNLRMDALAHSSPGSTVDVFWEQLMRLVAEPLTAGAIVPIALGTAAREHGQLILGVCSIQNGGSSLYGGGQKRKSTAAQCSMWQRSVRAVYDGPIALCSGDAAPADLSAAMTAGDASSPGSTWLLDGLELRLPRHPPVLSATFKAFQGNQLRILWYVRVLAELEALAPAARVLALDTRDILLQAPPFAAILAATSSSCTLVFVGDCTCAAVRDSYFKRWMHCLPPAGIDAIGEGPPPNGGITSGLVGPLRLLYERAATLAVSAASDCRAGGREQIVLTAAAYELKALLSKQVCFVPNDPRRQAAAFNMGVNNRIDGVKLNPRSGLVEAEVLHRPLAIVHQFDRRPAIRDFLMANLHNKSAAHHHKEGSKQSGGHAKPLAHGRPLAKSHSRRALAKNVRATPDPCLCAPCVEGLPAKPAVPPRTSTTSKLRRLLPSMGRRISATAATRSKLACGGRKSGRITELLRHKADGFESMEKSRPLSAPADCEATLSIYPGFERLLKALYEALDLDTGFLFGSPYRQFWPEVFLLDYFQRHRCRVEHKLKNRTRPHFYILPVLWRSISLLSDKAARSRFTSEAQRRVELEVLKAGSPFHTAPESHVLLHTSTAKPELMYGRKLAAWLADNRLMHLSFEGPGGDPRAGHSWKSSQYLVPGHRTIVVPYFIEPRAIVSYWLTRLCSLQCPAAQRAIKSAGMGDRVYLRCSANAQVRMRLLSAFRNVSGADVKVLDPDERKGPRSASTGFATQRPEQRLVAFLASEAALRASVFGLVPAGLTATSRRLYEVLDAGAIPVVVSDRATLPFAGNPSVSWSDAVLFHPERDIPKLPARLASISEARIAAMRAAGRSLARQLRYVDGEASTLVWQEMMRLGVPRGAV